MSSPMDNCPVCSRIRKDEVTASGDYCCVIQWGKDRVAVLKDHSDDADADAVEEAIDLLGFDNGNLMLSDFGEAAGHWGIKAVPADEIAALGTSEVGV